MLLAGHVNDAQRDAVDVDRIGGLEPADDEGDEIRAHHHRVGEPHGELAVGSRRAFDLGPVGHGEQLGVDDERDAEDRLEVRLVPARKRPPAVGGLHLRRGDDVLGAVVVAVRAAVEAAQLVVEHAREGDDDLDGPRLEAADRTDHEALGFGHERPRHVAAVDAHLADRRARWR